MEGLGDIVRIGKIARLTGTVAVTAALTIFGLKLVGADFSPLSGDQSFRQFLATYSLLSKGFYRPTDTKSLMHGAISGMVDALGDPFSRYMDPVMTARFREMVTSRFVGIGAVLTQDGGQAAIRSVVPGSPAQKAGIRAGDVLLSVNGVATNNLSLEQTVERIRGQAGTRVNMKIDRMGNVLSFSVLRTTIHETTVYARMLPDRIGYILITQFSEDTAKSFVRSLDILQSNGMKALVIDVRDDPGGYLQTVNKIADSLLPKGAVIEQIENRHHQRDVFKSTGTKLHIPMVALVDNGSASAAEILAAALQESAHVPLIGERTYGKGTVQETQEFADGSSLKLTIARWLTPDGQWIHKLGIAPTIAIPTPGFFHLPPLSMTARHPMQLNTNSVSVAVLQRMLLALGYSVDRTDGYFDLSTKQAVATFQRMHKLPISGVVDNATAYLLNISILSRRERQDPALTAALGYLQTKLMR